MSAKSVKLIEIDGSKTWVSSTQARQLLKDRLVKVIGRKPLALQEQPRICHTFSSQYLRGAGEVLKEYKRELTATIVKSRTGKPASAHEKPQPTNERYTPLPHGFGVE